MLYAAEGRNRDPYGDAAIASCRGNQMRLKLSMWLP
jgi:hypothetical protein